MRGVLLLYKEKQPEMLRALVGEEITYDFIKYVSYEIDKSKDEIKNYVKRK